ncbi:MAG: metalloregulator ArsR/SmtB family transcription factor [candidate division WOR-3 bacterium]
MDRRTGIKPMKEIHYRESRVAKGLGDPAKYAITKLLLDTGPLSVNEIAKSVRRSQPTVSHHLAQLKNLEIVRYEARSSGSFYWIKYPEEIRRIIKSLNIFVNRTLQGVNIEE